MHIADKPDNDRLTVMKMLEYDKLIEIVEASGMHTPPVIFVGPLKEAINISNKFTTKVPELFNWPLSDNKNKLICEGVVISSESNKIDFRTGHFKIDFKIKNKNEKFSEKKKTNSKLKVKKEIPEFYKKYLNEYVKYVNTTRLYNILIKDNLTTF